jgi:2-methylisocitrate lyase-like PEP mutase family enzyme
MSNVKKIALSTAVIVCTAFSALTAANAGFTREQAVSQGGTGVAAYSGDGGIVSSNWR